MNTISPTPLASSLAHAPIVDTATQAPVVPDQDGLIAPIHIGDLQTKWAMNGIAVDRKPLSVKIAQFKTISGVNSLDDAAAAARKLINPGKDTIIALLQAGKGGYLAAPIQVQSMDYSILSGQAKQSNLVGWSIQNPIKGLAAIVAGDKVTGVNYAPITGPIVAH